MHRQGPHQAAVLVVQKGCFRVANVTGVSSVFQPISLHLALALDIDQVVSWSEPVEFAGRHEEIGRDGRYLDAVVGSGRFHPRRRVDGVAKELEP